MMQLKIILEEFIGINEEEWAVFEQELSKEHFQAKTTVIGTGITAQKIYFIESGLMRTYYLQDGKEITTYFSCDNQFIATYASFLTQTPSMEFLETLEESSVITLSHSSLMKLYKLSPKYEKLSRIIAEQNFLCILERTHIMQTKKATDRYLDFINNNEKKIVQNAPQHQIASFLRITPESLSRIRKQLTIS